MSIILKPKAWNPEPGTRNLKRPHAGFGFGFSVSVSFCVLPQQNAFGAALNSQSRKNGDDQRPKTMAASAAKETDLRLADHFPLVHKTCKKPASKFFDCFSEKADQPPEGVRTMTLTLLLVTRTNSSSAAFFHLSLGARCGARGVFVACGSSLGSSRMCVQVCCCVLAVS